MFEKLGMDLEEKVKTKMVFDAAGARAQAQIGKEERAQAAREARQKRQEEIKKLLAEYKEAVAKFNKVVSDNALKVASEMQACFTEWVMQRFEMRHQQKAPAEAIKAARKARYQKRDDNIQKILDGCDPDINDFIEATIRFNPKKGAKLRFEMFHKVIKGMGIIIYSKWFKGYLALAKKMAKAMQEKQVKGFDNDRILQKIAEIPVKIDEKIDELRKKLDQLLGKYLDDLMYPHSQSFDVNKLIEKLKKYLDPVISSTSPLKPLVGKVPVISDLAKMLGGMNGTGSGKLTKEEIRKLVPKPPQPPMEIWNMILDITDDMMVLSMQLPMVLINVILEMLNMIYEKIKIITSVIPLGNMFPLSLVTAAIQACKDIWKLLPFLAPVTKKIVKAKIDEMYAEMAALFKKRDPKTPGPGIDAALFNTLVLDMAESMRKSKANRPRSYDDVTKEIYKSKLFDQGYTESQAKTVQKGYKEIFIGTDKNVPECTRFEDNGKEQVLEPDTTATPPQKFEAGFKESTLKREKPSVEAYEKYFNDLIKKSDLSAGLVYERMMRTQDVAGEWYKTYRDQLAKYKDYVVMGGKLTPSWVLQSRRKK